MKISIKYRVYYRPLYEKNFDIESFVTYEEAIEFFNAVRNDGWDAYIEEVRNG